MWGRPLASGGLSGRPALENSALSVALQPRGSEVTSAPAFAREWPAFVRYLPPARSLFQRIGPFQPRTSLRARRSSRWIGCSIKPNAGATFLRQPAVARPGTLSGPRVGDHAELRPSACYAAGERVEVARLAHRGYREASQHIAQTDRPTLFGRTRAMTDWFGAAKSSGCLVAKAEEYAWSSAGRPGRPPQPKGLPHLGPP
jgi:hypothetical protein